MNVCRNCGNIEENPGKYCIKCGKLLQQTSFCIRCGSPLNPGYKFCIHCGEPVKEEIKNSTGSILLNEKAPIVEEQDILDQLEPSEDNKQSCSHIEGNLDELIGSQEENLEDVDSDSHTATEYPENYTDVDSFYNENYQTPNSNKTKIWIGIILAAVIIGGGIWGYNAYVESASERERIEASNREVNAWNEYRSTDKGSAFLFMNGLLSEKTSNEVFSEIFDEYIKDNYGNEPDIDGKIQELVTNYSMKYTIPISLVSGMSSELWQKYSEWKESGSPLEWNPVEALETAGVFNFLSTEPVDKGKLVKIHYSLDPNRTGKEDGVINIKWENGGWTIDDFYKGGNSFKDYLSKEINDMSAPLLAEGNNFWEGEVIPETGLVTPVSIIFKVEDGQIVSAQFINHMEGKTLLLKPYYADGYDLGLESTQKDVFIRMNLMEDKMFVGKYNDYGEEIVDWDIQFRKE